MVLWVDRVFVWVNSTRKPANPTLGTCQAGWWGDGGWARAPGLGRHFEDGPRENSRIKVIPSLKEIKAPPPHHASPKE